MEPFKYEDYLYYKKIYYQKNNLYKLNDTDEKYNYENKEINQPHDKLFKEVLDNKKEAANLINQALNLKNIKYKLTIIEKPMEDEPKEFLMRVINYILEDKISEEKLKQFTVKLEKKKKGENIMFVEIINNWVDEMLAKEATLAQKEENIAQKEENIAQKEENIAQKEENVIRREEEFIQKQKELNEKERVLEKNKNRIVVEMLKNNVEEKIIMKILKIDKSELDKIKKENRYSA